MESSLEIKLNECIRWIHSNNFLSIALQFSVPLLKYSVSVVKYLEANTGSEYKYFVVYSDTCSVDHLSPLHLGEGVVDAIIRFGNICLAPMPETVTELPVLFMFSLDDNKCGSEFVEKWLQNLKDLSRCLFLYETSYTSIAQDLVRANVVSPKNVAKLNCYSTKWSFTSECEPLVSSLNTNCYSFGQFLIDRKIENYTKLIFIGSEVSLYYRITNFEVIHCINPSKRSVQDINPAAELRKRMACIEAVKSNRCRKIGIIYTNSYPTLKLEYFKDLSMKKGKEVHFISLVQSTDECKLANFTDLNAFVIAKNCYCSSLIDSIKLHVPLLNQIEFEISCGVNCEYAGIDWPSDDNDHIDELCNQIVEVDVSDKCLWFGLDVQSDAQEPSTVKEGQSGIASCYDSEPCN